MGDEQLPPLASAEDVTLLLYRDLDADEQGHVEQLLHSASAAVRDATGQLLTRMTTTAPVVVTDSPRLRLYQQPVVAVASVVIDGREMGGWELIGGELERPGGWVIGRRMAQVTYTHGYDPVPQPIRDLVVQLTLAAVIKIDEDGMLGTMPGLRQESISGNAYSATYGSDEPAPSSVLELSDRTKRWLRQSWGPGSVGTVRSR